MNLDIFFLGIIDNIHDFLNHNNKKNKEQLEIMINFLKNFYNIDILDVSKLDKRESYLKSLIDEIKNVDISTVKNNIKKCFLKDGISIKEINSNIIKNFDIVFFYKINDKNIKDLLSDLTKIKLRNQLYYLIELYRNNIENKYNKEINELIMFFLNYLNLLFLSDLEITNILQIIKTNIKKFINNKIKNYTYPITFFDDMTSGIDNFIYFNNQIINLDKTRIDGARTKNIDSYLTKKLDTNIYIKSDKEQGEESIGFKITSDLKVEYMDFNYYLEDIINNYNIVCEFKNKKFYDKSLKFKFKNNDISTILDVVYDISNFIKYIKDIKNKKTLTISEIYKLLNNSCYNKLFDRENFLLYLKNIFKLLKKSINDKIIEGFIITILFGVKRFGDWVQYQASKKYYFLIQTKDFYSQIYGSLIKAPVIINDVIYNYNPPDRFLSNLSFNGNELKIFDSKNIKDLTNEKIIIRSLRDIEVEPNKLYLDKYLKYKNKYLNLKKQIGGSGAGSGSSSLSRSRMLNSAGLVLFNDKGDFRLVLVILNSKTCFNKDMNITVPKVSTPGGIIDRGETHWTAFAREYQEEVGQALPRLYRVGRDIPSYDDIPTKTRIYYSYLINPKERIRYDITRVKNRETIGIIFPKLKHIKQMIDNTPRGEWIFIETEGKIYCLRNCVAKSLKRMFDSGLLDRYL